MGPTFNHEEKQGWLAGSLVPEAAGARVNDASHCQLHFCFRAAETL